MLFNLLLASITVLLCFFFFFLVTFNSFFVIPVVKENIKVKLALPIPVGIQITLVKEIILIPPDVTDKTIKVLSIKSKAAMYLLSFLLIVFLSWISVLK